jgi:hypothetical protein
LNLAGAISHCHNTPVSAQPSPTAILQTAVSFWSSKVLLTAVAFGVFTRLAGPINNQHSLTA